MVGCERGRVEIRCERKVRRASRARDIGWFGWERSKSDGGSTWRRGFCRWRWRAYRDWRAESGPGRILMRGGIESERFRVGIRHGVVVR